MYRLHNKVEYNLDCGIYRVSNCLLKSRLHLSFLLFSIRMYVVANCLLLDDTTSTSTGTTARTMATITSGDRTQLL